MKKRLAILAIASSALLMTSCSENYSNGSRVGTINKFSKKGIIWKTDEAHLNITQTGMTSTDGFDFSIDRDNQPEGLFKKVKSAADSGWKVEVVYHEVTGWNWLSNRGETSHFVTDMRVIDKNFSNDRSMSPNPNNVQSSGRVVDTVYVVIMPNDPRFKNFVK